MKNFVRFLYVSKKLVPVFVVFALTRHKPQSKRFQETLVKIRLTLQQLGTTYVKIGQLLSARPDIAGADLAAELRKLLDEEPVMPFATIKHIIKQELHQDISELFEDFKETPLSAASIAQVHEATLKNGKKVAVKIQRSGLEKTIPEELAVFKQVAMLLDTFTNRRGINFRYLYDEFASWITNELDFTVEGKRAEMFAKNMKGVEGITVPEIYWKYTTSKVLTMSFIEGLTANMILHELEKQHVHRIPDAKLPYVIDQNLAVQRAVTALVKQVVVDKFFHGDMHPANIIVQKHSNVAFVDYGIVGYLDNNEHAMLMYIILGFIDNDPELVIKVLQECTIKPLTNEQVKVLQNEISKELHLIHENSAGKISLSHFLRFVLTIAYDYRVSLSPGMIIGAKSFSQLDSVASLIGVDKPIVDFIKPAFEKYFSQSLTSGLSKELLYKNVMEFLDAGKQLPDTIVELETAVHNMPTVTNSANTISDKKNTLRPVILIIVAVIISLPLISLPIVKENQYSTILTLVIPLVLVYILNKIL